MTEPQNNRIIIYGPKEDGTYVAEFRSAGGESLAISVPRGETSVLKHFQAQMPYGLCRPTTHVKERFCRRASRVKAASCANLPIGLRAVYSTLGRSGHRTPHRSCSECASRRGQSLLRSRTHALMFPRGPCFSGRGARGASLDVPKVK
jgi:hypothetical protein